MEYNGSHAVKSKEEEEKALLDAINADGWAFYCDQKGNKIFDLSTAYGAADGQIDMREVRRILVEANVSFKDADQDGNKVIRFDELKPLMLQVAAEKGAKKWGPVPE